MSDGLDRRIEGLMVRVMAMAPEPPPFPRTPSPSRVARGVGWSGWKVGFAVGWGLFVLVAIPLLWLNRDTGPSTPSATVPATTLPSNTSPPTAPSTTSLEPQPSAALSCTLRAPVNGVLESATQEIAVAIGAAGEITLGSYAASFRVVDGDEREGLDGLGLLVDIYGPVEPENQAPDLPDGVIMRVVGGIFPDPAPGQQQVSADAADGVSFACEGAGAAAEPPAAAPGLLTVSAVEASSELGSEWTAANLIDGSLATEWQDRSLSGRGAVLVFRFQQPVAIEELVVYNLPDDDRFRQNHRIRGYRITVDDLSYEIVGQLADVNTRQIIAVGTISTRTLVLEVTSTYEAEAVGDGGPFNELAIAEIEFRGNPASPPAPTTEDPSRSPDDGADEAAGVCSTTGLDVALEAQPDLPVPVAATRRAIFDAAMSCDYDVLQGLADAGDEFFTASFGGGGVEYYADLEQRGIPALADLVAHLNQPYVLEPLDDSTGYYVWPSAFILLESPGGDGLSDGDYAELLELYTVEDLEEMFDGLGGYVGWRIAILDSGEWWFFVAGD